MKSIILLALILISVAAGGAAQAQSRVGHWTGRGEEVQGTQFHSSYDVLVEFRADGTGFVRYPGLACAAKLTPLGRAGGGWRFRETIVEGRDKCVDGFAFFFPRPTGLLWVWTGATGISHHAAAFLRRRRSAADVGKN